MRRKSLLNKMILFGSVISILPVLIIGLFSYIQSSKQVQERVNQAELQYVRQLNANIEQVLKTVDHTLTNLAESRVMEDALYSVMSAPNFQLYNNLKSEITHLQSFDTKVEDVIIVNKQRNWLIKNSGIKRLNEHPDERTYLDKFELIHNTSWLLVEKNSYKDAISSRSCPYMISLVKKLPNITINKYALAIANIPACSIAELITDGEGQEEIIVLNEEQRIVLHKDSAMIGKPLSSHPVYGAEMSFDGPSGQLQAMYDSRPYTVTYYKSTFNGWTYLSVVSIDQLTEESRQIGWLTLGISLFIMILSILFVLLGTNKLYTPLKRLVKAIEGRDSGSEVSPRNEVQVIEDHIKHLFNSNSKLESEMRSQVQQVSSLFLHRMLSGSLRDAEIHEKMNYFGFQPHWQQMAVLAIQVDTLENTHYESKDLELLLFAMLNISEEVIPKKNRLPVILMDRSVVVVAGYKEESWQQVEEPFYQLTELLKNLITRYLGLSASIGISAPFQEMKYASRAYEESLEALTHRIRLGKGIIVPFSSLHSGKPSVAFEYPARIEHDLIQAIKLAEQEEAVLLLRNWMAEAINQIQLPDHYQLSLVRLLNRLLLLGQEAGIALGKSGTYRMSLYEEVLALHVSGEIEDWFKGKLIMPMLQQFAERRHSQDQKLSERIIDLIQNHYDFEFTLEDCAVRLHYNASYLSSVFKKETGYTFSEYLASYRLHIAKQWLTETDMTVKEIAERLKYNNSHNFIRAFRKQEDMTPGQYRSQYSSL
ncbi:helix-turn-helix domain-containing protein [Paenibacillus paridis]|uniref:helix-turn-helix domain-containing protein n=1 Tax=Paenibacillus paridis TaxID=2583376 RepID=UPI0011228185|nr:helix-turn-helix domain-containing protein [Paenibacillus paridis]